MQSPTNVVGRRFGAFIIDGLVTLAISAIAWFALTTQVPGKCPSSGGGFTIGDNCRGFLVGQEGKQTAWYVIALATALLIYVILPGLRGASPGKAMMGIRVVNAEGQPPGILRALLRYVLLIVDGFPYFIPYLTALIVILNSRSKQRVGDMAAGTFVIDKNAAAVPVQQQFAPTAGFSAPPTGAPVAAPPPQPQQQQQQQQQKADWYPDPHGQARLRYWDGQRWTDHTSA